MSAMRSAPAVPHRWPWLVRLFRWHACRYVHRHFHAVRLSKSGHAFPTTDEPLLVVLNHPSWWDPLIGIVLSRKKPGMFRAAMVRHEIQHEPHFSLIQRIP